MLQRYGNKVRRYRFSESCAYLTYFGYSYLRMLVISVKMPYICKKHLSWKHK